MTASVRLALRATFTLACILLIILLMGITWSLGARRTTRAIMQTAFRAGTAVFGIRIHVQGALEKARPLLVVSNHFSYLDLFVLGSHIPAAFTPKSEIRSWPLVGFMCKVAGCLFIDRRTSRTGRNKAMLEHALAAGDIISLFPEGTTSDGSGLLPFKTSLFSLAEGRDLLVQPVSITYTALNGRELDASSIPRVGWYGDAYFFPHVAQFLRQRNVDVTLHFHDSVLAKSFESRKMLALYCREIIEQGIKADRETKKAPLE